MTAHFPGIDVESKTYYDQLSQSDFLWKVHIESWDFSIRANEMNNIH